MERKSYSFVSKYFTLFQIQKTVLGESEKIGAAALQEDQVGLRGMALFQKLDERWLIHLTQRAMGSVLRSELAGEVFDWNDLSPSDQQRCLDKVRGHLETLGVSGFLRVVEAVKSLGGVKTVGGFLSFLAKSEEFFNWALKKYSAEEALNFLLQTFGRHQDIYEVMGSLELIDSLRTSSGLRSFSELSETLEPLMKLIHQSGLESRCHRDLMDAWNILIISGITNPKVLFGLTRRCHDLGQLRHFDVIAKLIALNLKKNSQFSDSELLALVDAFARPIKMAASLGGEGVSDFFEIFQKLNLEVSFCQPEFLAAHLAERWNVYVADALPLGKLGADDDSQIDEFASACGAMVYLLDALHHASQESGLGTSLRKQFVLGLSSEAAYALLSAPVTSRYASTFGLIWSNQQERYACKNLSAWLEKVDPQGAFWQQFLMNLVAYNPWGKRVKNSLQLNRHDADFFLDQVGQFIEKAELNFTSDAPRLLKLTQRILPYAGLESRQDLAWRFMRLSHSSRFTVRQAAAVFFLKVFADRLGMEMEVEWRRELAEFPDLPMVKFPDPTWKSSGRIQALQRFYPDENWFEYAFELYRQQGWKEDDAYLKNHGLDPRRYRALNKTVEGVALLMVLELYDSQSSLLNLKDFTLRVHRGHVYNVDQTFTGAQLAEDAPEAVNINGGCHGFFTMLRAEFSLSGASLIGDVNVGEGQVTSRLVEDLMVGMARGERDWKFLAEYQKQGFVFPDDPAFRMREYRRLFDEANASRKNRTSEKDEELNGEVQE